MDNLKKFVDLMDTYQNNHSAAVVLHEAIVNGFSFDDASQFGDINQAHEFVAQMMHALFDIEFGQGSITGKPKLDMDKLFNDLLNMRYRLINYQNTQKAN